jgi:putative ABC transport system permease protein
MPDWKSYVRDHLPPLSVPAAREREIVEELAQQLEQRFSEELARGASELEAAEFAREQFSDWDRLGSEIRKAERRVLAPLAEKVPENWKAALSEDQLRSRRGGNVVRHFLQDVRYALRLLKKSPSFTALVVFTLALGIGANSTIFSVVNAVLLRPLPYFESDRLVNIVDSNPSNGWPRFSSAPANFLDWRERAHSFEHLVAYANDEWNAAIGELPEHWVGVAGTQGFFETLRARPEYGRLFNDDDFVEGKSNVLVISDALWRKQFSGDPDVIGRGISLEGKSFTVIGVMPPDFHFGGPDKLFWSPFPFDSSLRTARGAHFLRVMGRLRDGIRIEQAQAEMTLIAAQLEKQYPQTNGGWTARVESMQAASVRTVRTALLVLLGAVAGVLLIACANAANMLLARAAVRRREIAMRTALGASRSRIVIQLLTESTVLASAGGALGLIIAVCSARALATLPPQLLPRANSIHVDLRVLLFTFALAMVTGILFGTVPALFGSRGDLAGSLKEGGRASTASWAGMRKALIVSEVALAFILLAGSGLLIRSFARLTSVQPGFATESRLIFSISLPSSRYKTPQQQTAFFEQAREKLAAMPGVLSTSLTSLVPMSGDSSLWSIGINGQENGAALPSAMYYLVDPGYRAAMGIPLIQGRDFSDRDNAASQHVVIVNDYFARTLLPGQNPIGQHVQLGRNYSVVREIVGVAGTVKQEGLDEKATYQVYEPLAQMPRGTMTFILKAATDAPLSLLPAAQRTIQSIDAQMPITNPSTFEQEMSESVALPKLRAFLLGIFAALAVALALVGLYGVMSYTVTEQTQEIGVRMALGAIPRDVYQLILGRGMTLVAIGIALGIAGAFGLTRLLESFLFGVSPHDAWTLASSVFAFVAIAAVACLVPARRAAKLDPLIALRYE